MVVSTDVSSNARLMAHALHVPIDKDTQEDHKHTPLLMPLDDEGRPVLHVSDSGDIDFYQWKIDYVRQDYHVAASRRISMVTPGFHTNLVYFPKTASERIMEIHSGVGYLILGNLSADEDDFATTIFKLDSEVTRQVSVPSGRFFTIEAPEWSDKPLVVSELFEIKSGNELKNAEVILKPGDQVIDTPDGHIEVPEEFSAGNFD